jgi:general secretion pathway protein K
VNDVSVFNFPQPNVNGANVDVMAAAGQYTEAQAQHIADFLAGNGQFAQQGQNWFQSASTLTTVAGVGGNANAFGTTITALRITITVHDGRSQYRLSAIVSPQGGATLNQTNATNATSAAATASARTTATSPLTNSTQPSSTASGTAAAAAASQSINYPFTLLQILEDDEIPQSPPAVVPPS